MGEVRNVYTILAGKSEGKKALGRSRHRQMIILNWILGIDVWEDVVIQEGTGGAFL
jgi:hypothetical protein